MDPLFKLTQISPLGMNPPKMWPIYIAYDVFVVVCTCACEKLERKDSMNPSATLLFFIIGDLRWKSVQVYHLWEDQKIRSLMAYILISPSVRGNIVYCIGL